MYHVTIKSVKDRFVYFTKRQKFELISEAYDWAESNHIMQDETITVTIKFIPE